MRFHFWKKTVRRDPPIVWAMWEHSGWGDALYWHENGKVVQGLTSPRGTVGDEIRATTKGGRVARFRVVGVEYARDPLDLWYADVEFFGYEDESITPVPPVTRFSVFGGRLPDEVAT